MPLKMVIRSPHNGESSASLKVSVVCSVSNVTDKMEDKHEKSTSHKEEKNKSYTLEFKLEVIKFAELNSNRAASKKFHVDEKRVRE